MAEKTMIVRILSAERLNNSVNGNPRYKLILASPVGAFPSWAGSWLTMSDALCNYDVENLLRENTDVEVTLSRAERIRSIKRCVR